MLVFNDISAFILAIFVNADKFLLYKTINSL